MSPEGRPAVSAAIRATALSLRVDAVTAEVVGRLQNAGVRSILLKGPSLAAWLYADGTARPYRDTDLLVPASGLTVAERELSAMGFVRRRPGWQELAWDWVRRPDDAIVDVHTSLFGVSVSPKQLWEELSTRTEPRRVGGVEVEAPARVVLAFHVALHAAQHGGELGQHKEDLSRALVLASQEDWSGAVALALTLDAAEAFAAGLRSNPAGAELANRLSLPRMSSATVALHAAGAPPLVLAIEHLATAPSWGARLRFVGRKLAPAPALIRGQSPLANRGSIGLLLAYIWQPVRLLAGAPRALLAWRRARRDATPRR